MKITILFITILLTLRLSAQTFKIVPGNVLDFGEVEAGTNKTMELLLINTSDTPFWITYAFTADCCFMPEWDMSTAYYGDTLSIKYHFSSFSFPPGMKFLKSTYIETNSKNHKFKWLEIIFKARLIPQKSEQKLLLLCNDTLVKDIVVDNQWWFDRGSIYIKDSSKIKINLKNLQYKTDYPEIKFGLVNLSDTPLIASWVGWGEPCIEARHEKEAFLKGDTFNFSYKIHCTNFGWITNQPNYKISYVRGNFFDFSIGFNFTIDDLLNGDTIFQSVEKMPAFKGGNAAMLRYINKNFKYPKQDYLQTEFTVEFIVDTSGKIINPQIASDYHNTNLSPAETNLLEVFKTMPAWTPGWHNGRKVPVRMRVPVIVELKD